VGRFVEGEDGSRSTLLPKRLGDYLTEGNPVSAVDAFGANPDLAGTVHRPGFHTEHGSPATSPSRPAANLYLRLPQSRAVQPSPGGRAAAEHRADVGGRVDWRPTSRRSRSSAKTNGTAIREICCEWVVQWWRLDQVSQALVAITGSKFQVVTRFELYRIAFAAAASFRPQGG